MSFRTLRTRDQMLHLIRIPTVLEVDVVEGVRAAPTVAAAHFLSLSQVRILCSEWSEAAQRLQLLFFLDAVLPRCLELICPFHHILFEEAGRHH